jgi:hypothetical protein
VVKSSLNSKAWRLQIAVTPRTFPAMNFDFDTVIQRKGTTPFLPLSDLSYNVIRDTTKKANT